MGRKIPGRKHRGVKDPEKQAAARFNSIKDKINSPPANPDDQQISKTLQKVIELKNKVKSGEFNNKPTKKVKRLKVQPAKQKNTDPNISNSPKKTKIKYEVKSERPVPVFEQKPSESDRQFINRINRICENVTKEAAFEEKYGVEIKRNQAGEVTGIVKRPKDELEVLVKKAKKEKKDKKIKKKKTNLEEEGPKLTKSQKWKKKKKEKKLKQKLKNIDDFEKYRDQVKFGETVHAPPTLVVPKKVKDPRLAPRPGKKTLILKAIMENDSLKPEKPHTNAVGDQLSAKNIPKIVDKKGKRKTLPTAMRRQLDNQQKEIISAYKMLKAKKYANS